MMFQQKSISRRTFLGIAAAGLALPKVTSAQEKSIMKVKFKFADHEFTADLYDNPSARDLASMLPLNALKIEDYSNNEKIAYLPRKLSEDEAERYGNEQPGDLCYYAPWGNLVFFYASYRYSRDLIRLGRLDGWKEALMTRGEFPLTAEAV